MSPVAVPRWAVMSTGILSLCGVGISTYLTIAHFVGTQILACSDNALVNCTAVTTSKQSYFLGMPVAVLGLAFYLVMFCLLYTSPSPRDRTRSRMPSSA